MNSFEYVITDPIGIHARPAGMLVKEAKKYSCNLLLESKGKKADLKKIMILMSLGVKCGDKVTVTADGEDEERVLDNLKKYFEANL